MPDPADKRINTPLLSPTGEEEEAIRRGIELLFYAYRDFTADPDRILAPLGMGRAHHRVLHFVRQTPGMTVGELLVILRITKQSLNRVLGHLVRDGYVLQRPGEQDRRERRLTLAAKGEDLERQLAQPQRKRVAAAYAAVGPAAVAAFQTILLNLVNPEDRGALSAPSRLK